MKHAGRSIPTGLLSLLVLAACGADEGPTVDTAQSPLTFRELTRDCSGPNLLLNPDFALHGAPSVLVTTADDPVRTALSTADSWYMHNGMAGTTTVEVVSLPGVPVLALHVTTTAGQSGVLQQFLPPDTGPSVGAIAAQVDLRAGSMGVGVGAVGTSGTGLTQVHGTGPRPRYFAPNGTSPMNQAIFLAESGPADFYVLRPAVTECAGARVLAVSEPVVSPVPRPRCPGRLEVSATIDVAATGADVVRWELVRTDVDAAPLDRGRVDVAGSGMYEVAAAFRADAADPGGLAFRILEPNPIQGPSAAYQAECGARELVDDSAFSPAATRLGFDELELNVDVATVYADLGLTFDDDESIAVRTFADDRATPSPPHFIFQSAFFPATGANIPIVMHFAPRVRRVGMTVGGCPGAHPLCGTRTLTAYDEDGVLLFSTSAVVDRDITQFMGFDAGTRSIAEVRLDAGDTLAAETLDDLVFER